MYSRGARPPCVFLFSAILALDGCATGTQGPGDAQQSRTCVARASAVSGLPIACATATSPRPQGKPANLRVLDWAGFKSAVTYTFDDGQPSHISHYRALLATGVRMTFFLTTANAKLPGFVATFQQAVRDGHELGNHGVAHCHANLQGCVSGQHRASLAAEIDESSRFIIERLGQPAVWTAAAPFGDGGYEPEYAKRVLLNRGIYDGLVGPHDGTAPYSLPTYMVAPTDTASSFRRAIHRAQHNGKWVIFCVHTLTPTDANWYNPIPLSVVTGSVEYAQSLGDVWIDSLVNVGAYWRAQSLLAATSPTVVGQRSTWTWKLPAHFPPGKFLRVAVDGGTLSQAGRELPWDEHGYYEVALDEGELTLSP